MIRLGRFEIPEDEFEWAFACSGGPGGQNVNKVASKAQLRWHLADSTSLPAHVKERLQALNRRRLTTEGDLLMSSQRFRDQLRNRDDCLEKLAELLTIAATLPKHRQATKPTRASKHRRVADKRHNSAAKATRRTPSGDE